MPLNPATLQQAILRLTNPDGSGFKGWPSSSAQAASNWAGVMRSFFSEMVFPVVPPTAHVAAESAARGVLSGIAGGLPVLKQAWLVYAVTLAGGVLPPVVALPPTSPPPIALGGATDNAAVPAASMAAAVFAWSKTGLAGPPPAGPVTPWS